jgi:hypothetical protein
MLDCRGYSSALCFYSENLSSKQERRIVKDQKAKALEMLESCCTVGKVERLKSYVNCGRKESERVIKAKCTLIG